MDWTDDRLISSALADVAFRTAGTRAESDEHPVTDRSAPNKNPHETKSRFIVESSSPPGEIYINAKPRSWIIHQAPAICKLSPMSVKPPGTEVVSLLLRPATSMLSDAATSCELVCAGIALNGYGAIFVFSSTCSCKTTSPATALRSTSVNVPVPTGIATWCSPIATSPWTRPLSGTGSSRGRFVLRGN